MEKMPPEMLFEFWQKGKTLEEALLAFCDKKFIQALPQKPNTKVYKPKETKDSFEAISNAAAHFAEFQRKQHSHIEK